MSSRTALATASVFAVLLFAAGGATSAPPGLIVYWSDSPAPSLWAVRPDGSGARRILLTKANAKRPRLSPDRRWVAFDGGPPGKAPPMLDQFKVQLVRTTGADLRQLTYGSTWDVDAQWSPDGQWICFSRLERNAPDTHGAVLWLIHPNGTGLRRLTRGFGARWSPDGRNLVYEAPSPGGESALSVIGADGTEPHSIVGLAGIEQPASWSPDGARILFTRYAIGGAASMYIVRTDGSGLGRLGSGIGWAWSPDATRILYSSSYLSDLRLMNADGTHRRLLARVRAAEADWR
jgi:TolB protein